MSPPGELIIKLIGACLSFLCCNKLLIRIIKSVKVVSVISSLMNNRPIEDRTIAGIELLTNGTLIMLNHPLPPRVMSGEIKAEKWEVTLHTDYMSESKYNVDYDIVKDFTPNYDLPLLRGDLASNHLLHNEAMAIIDKKIKELEEKIDSLGS